MMEDKREMAKDRIKSACQKVMQAFESGQVLKSVALAVYPPLNIPAANWSLCNQIIVAFSGTQDARGYRQWQKAKRQVRKGEKAGIFILAPRFVKKEKEDKITGEKKEETFLAGFLGVPIFAVEQTEGEPLDYQKLALPPLPLLDK